jgi:hypothetical protein
MLSTDCFARRGSSQKWGSLALSDAFLVAVETRRQRFEFDALADVDEIRIDVVFEGLNRAVGPRLEVRADVDERVRVDDIPRDAGVRFPAVAVQSGRDEVLDGYRCPACDLAGEVVETEEKRHCDRAVRAACAAVTCGRFGPAAGQAAGEPGCKHTRAGTQGLPAGEFTRLLATRLHSNYM